MYKEIKIKKLIISLVFRHKYEKNQSFLDKTSLWKTYNLGLWYRKDIIVGQKNFNNPKLWKYNYVNNYMIGIDLILCKAWLSINYN
jgi:hypothetical protein